MKIRSKISLAFALIFILSTLLIVRTVDRELLPRYKQPVEDTLVDTSHLLAATLANASAAGQLDGSRISLLLNEERHIKNVKLYGKLKVEQELIIYVTDERGQVIYHSLLPGLKGSDFSRWNDVYLTLKGEYGARATRLDPKDAFSTTMYVASPIFINNKLVGVVSVGKPIMSFHSFIINAKWRLYTSVLIIILASLLVVLLLSAWITRPIERLQKYIQSLASNSPLEPPGSSTREINELTQTFLSLKEKLDSKEYVENYINHLTHEIRSPLSAILGAAEILQNPTTPEAAKIKLTGNIHVESKRLQQIAEQLLELASLEKRSRPLQLESFDLNLVIHEILDSCQIALEKKKIKVSFDGQTTATITAERFLIWRALANVVQNAIDFSPIEGTLKITTEISENQKIIRVDDDGPGIPEYAKPRIFERFFSTERPDTQRKGTGLGLVFTREVLEQHGGTIELANRTPHGCSATIKIN